MVKKYEVSPTGQAVRVTEESNIFRGIVNGIMGVGLLVGLWFLCGCSSHASVGSHAEISGDATALVAMADMLNGIARTAKEKPEQSSEYFAHRATEEREITKRFTFIPGAESK